VQKDSEVLGIPLYFQINYPQVKKMLKKLKMNLKKFTRKAQKIYFMSLQLEL